MIASQISGLDAALAEARGRAGHLSYDTVAGDKDAAAALARENANIAGMEADRAVLVTAMARARQLEAEASSEAAQAERAAARIEARGHVTRLLDAARRADAMLSSWAELAAEMAEAEAAARDAARRAGGILNDTRVGQRGSVAHSADLLARTATGAIKANTVIRPAEEFVSIGWRDLIEGEIVDV